jgi:hypothetical protein
VSLTPFFVDAFTAALDRGIASAEDILRHATPSVLAAHLPRSLWARLLNACLGAARVDASTIIDTVGLGNLCEHLPKPMLWACLAEMAATALGGARLGMMDPRSGRASTSDILLPPPPIAENSGARSGTHNLGTTSADETRAPEVGRSRTPTRPPMRGLGTSRIPSAGASTRRPQVPGPAPTGPAVTALPPMTLATGATSPTLARDDLGLDFEIETDLRSDWKGKDPIPVDDEQLVDWSANEETMSGSATDRNKP